MKSCVHRPWLFGVLLAGGSLYGADASWDALLKSSPFGPGGASAPGPAASASAPLEFRSYFVEGREAFFSIYDPAKKRSYWLRSGETEGALAVRRFDAERQNLGVEYEGRPLSLALKQAQLQASVPVPAAGAPTPGTAVTTPAGDAAVSPEMRRAEQNLARAKQRIEFENRQKQRLALAPKAPAAPAAK